MQNSLTLRHSRAVMDRILDTPQLVAAVQSLEPRVLIKLIEHVGLEDCAELVALSSATQLAAVFDEDLWTSCRPGMDESFDLERFGLWLAILVDQGAELAARKLLEVDGDLLTLALCKLVLVVDNDALTEHMFQGEHRAQDELAERALESSLCHELDEYLVISRRGLQWDAVLAVLVELHASEHETLRGLLSRCASISAEYIDDNGGLYDVLTSEEMIESDLAAEREQRREQAGYVAPSAAVSFLRLACTTPLAELLDARELDPVTRAHFRGLAPAHRTPATRGESLVRRAPGEAAAGANLLGVLRDAGVLSRKAEPKLLADGGALAGVPLLAHALSALAARDPAAHAQRLHELVYLANLLLAGLGTKQLALRPVDAAQAALLTCNLGAEYMLANSAAGARTAAGAGRTRRKIVQLERELGERNLVRLFQVGVHLLCGPGPAPKGRGASRLGPLRELLRQQGLVRGAAMGHTVAARDRERR